MIKRLLSVFRTRILGRISRPIFDQIHFEIVSWWGRLRQQPWPVDRTKKNYLHLGCGSIYLPGFLNADFYSVRPKDLACDLRFPLPLESGVIDGLLCEHTFEHLTYEEDQRLFSECRRVLKPGGTMRIILPDLEIFLRRYGADDLDWFSEWERITFEQSSDCERKHRRLGTPLQAISFITQEFGHRSAWDFATLRHFLLEAGFRDVRRRSFREGADSALLQDCETDDRRYISFYTEATA